ncbi:MAG: hypothetical protein EA402_05515 [Planctomycetota bacterium]|nr:MAG: hypothetical protein EA402_05515 [Planctomycetota bacterium]
MVSRESGPIPHSGKLRTKLTIKIAARLAMTVVQPIALLRQLCRRSAHSQLPTAIHTHPKMLQK